MDYALEVKGLSKTYKKSGFTLDNVSFTVPKGTIVGLVGENGAGKSTTIGCILNTIFRDRGEVKLLGQEMRDEDTQLRQRIGVVYDGDNFPGYYTAEQLAEVMRRAYQQWDDSLFEKYLLKFGLDRKQKIKTYSKGMIMKLAIGTALAHKSELLILDEATSGLDPVMREEMLEIFLEFIENENHSILLSSHITSDLEKIADYITFLHEGKVILTVEKDEILYRYGIIRCKDGEFEALDEEDRIAWQKRAYQIDVLVPDREKAARKYKGAVIDHASIDEVMLLLTKGERI